MDSRFKKANGVLRSTVVVPLIVLIGCATAETQAPKAEVPLTTLQANAPQVTVPQATTSPQTYPETDTRYWQQSAIDAIRARAAAHPNPAPAKNVILFIGDGMGLSTVTAARIYDGQSKGRKGEEHFLPYEKFPHTAFIKTYNTNAQVPDSAGTATALHSGVKTRAGMIGMNANAVLEQCDNVAANAVPTMGQVAKARGKAVGVVTTTTLTHATPATVYANAPTRKWENDSLMSAEARAAGCQDLARQFVSDDPVVTVAFAGGRVHFLGQDKGGARLDPGADLIAEWQARTKGRVISTRDQLNALQPQANGYVLGLFAPSHMSYQLHKTKTPTAAQKSVQDSEINRLLAQTGKAEPSADPMREPSLAEMTAAAIKLLAQHDGGYYLMVEGGRIDHGHHEGTAALALSEAQEMARAVETALSLVDLKDTTIIVTADHSHPFTMAGVPKRGNPILGTVHAYSSHGDAHGDEAPSLATDGKPYTTLGYWTGPGALKGERPDLSATDTTAADYRQQSVVPTGINYKGTDVLIGSHGGEDVPLYAVGPRAYMFGGVLEQHVVFHLMKYAFGWTEDRSAQ